MRYRHRREQERSRHKNGPARRAIVSSGLVDLPDGEKRYVVARRPSRGLCVRFKATDGRETEGSPNGDQRLEAGAPASPNESSIESRL